MELLNLNLPALLFYFFAVLMIGSATMVILMRNPVYSVLFLIFAFFNAAGLFLLLGAEYLAMTLVIVYVGAVAVLFLFVVMMLNINIAEWKQGLVHYASVGIGLAVLLFVQLGALFMASYAVSPVLALTPSSYPIPDPKETSNTQALGEILYTDYVYAFQLAGLVLLIAMIGSIVLTLRHRAGVRKQVIAKQLARQRRDGVQLVDVKSGQGV